MDLPERMSSADSMDPILSMTRRIGLPPMLLRLGSAMKRRAASSNQSFFSEPAAIFTSMTWRSSGTG